MFYMVHTLYISFYLHLWCNPLRFQFDVSWKKKNKRAKHGQKFGVMKGD